MSINNFSSSHPNTLWGAQQEAPHQQHLNTTSTGSSQEKQVQEFHKEIMFEKPLTPSDVGKLNRLVIPKQHAEKHFPLSDVDSSIDKGLLLCFEDEFGKSWPFRYSYWNSSQSYVLTKGWNKYVKEKTLEAGDVVFFARHRTDSDRLFIGWRRRGTTAAANCTATPQYGEIVEAYSGGGGWSRTMVRSGQRYPYPRHHHGHGPSVPYQSRSIHAGSVVRHHQTVEATAAVNSSSKTLRLFGVNLECQLEDSDTFTPDSSSWSRQSHSQAYHQMQQ